MRPRPTASAVAALCLAGLATPLSACMGGRTPLPAADDAGSGFIADGRIFVEIGGTFEVPPDPPGPPKPPGDHCPAPDAQPVGFVWNDPGVAFDGWTYDGNVRVEKLWGTGDGWVQVQLAALDSSTPLVGSLSLSSTLASGLFEGAEYRGSLRVEAPWWTQWTLTLQAWDRPSLSLFLASGPADFAYRAPGLESFLKFGPGRACDVGNDGCGPQEDFSLMFASAGSKVEVVPGGHGAIESGGETYRAHVVSASRYVGRIECTDTPSDWVEVAIAPPPLNH